MPPYRHRTQRRFHTFRYGYRHWAQHQDGVRHPHRRRKKRKSRRFEIPEKRTLVLVGSGVGIVLLFLALQGAYALNKANHQVAAAQQSFARIVNEKATLLTPMGRARAASDLSQCSQFNASIFCWSEVLWRLPLHWYPDSRSEGLGERCRSLQ